MNRYIIDFENAHWCGGQANCVVFAESPDEALIKAEVYMEEYQRELFSDEYGESVDGGDEEYADDCAYTVNSVELFDETHEEWEFYQDPVQRANFYPEIN
jgi:hypothetical protein